MVTIWSLRGLPGLPLDEPLVGAPSRAPVLADVDDATGRARAAQQREQRVQGLLGPLGHHLDAAVVEVGRAAAQAELERAGAGPPAEADALHPPLDVGDEAPVGRRAVRAAGGRGHGKDIPSNLERPVTVPRARRAGTALTTAVLAGVLLTGCTDQPQPANDNGPQPDPAQPGDVLRTPEAVEEAPAVVEELPAEKQVEVPEVESED